MFNIYSLHKKEVPCRPLIEQSHVCGDSSCKHIILCVLFWSGASGLTWICATLKVGKVKIRAGEIVQCVCHMLGVQACGPEIDT